MDKNVILSECIFPNVTKTVQDLENMFPKRSIEGYVLRYAPSPTGFTHTGNLFATLIDMQIAKQNNGVFMIRIEDTDTKRTIEGSAEALIKSLEKFGIYPNEGITINGEIGNYGPYTQSKRKEIYEICAKHLISKGLAYPCFCTGEMLNETRKMQEKNKQITGYYGVYAKCRNISVDEMIERVKSGEKYIIRFKSSGNHLRKITFNDSIRGKVDMAENDQDVVIIKSDGLPTYHFAHVVDDHFMRVTHVFRGEEWLPSTALHVQLFNQMEFELPKYAHFANIMVQEGSSKRKLSKRKDKEADVKYFLNSGYPTEAVIEYLLTLINSNFEIWRKNNLDKSIFDFEIKFSKMNTSSPLFDIVKLNDVSKEYIARLSSKELLDKALIWSKEYNNEIYEMLNKDLDYSLNMLVIERDNVKKIRKDLIKYDDILPCYIYFFEDKFIEDILKGYVFDYTDKITKSLIIHILNKYIEIYNHNDSKEEWFSKIKNLSESFDFCTNMKEYKLDPDKYIGNVSDIASIIRISITNRQNTPDMYAIMQVLGEDKVIHRIQTCVKNLERR